MNQSRHGSSGASIERALFTEKLRFIIESNDSKGRSPIVVTRGTPASEVLAHMRERRSGGVLVTDSAGSLAGIFTERDFLDKLADDSGDEAAAIEKYMTPNPVTLSAEDTVGEAIRLMTDGGYRHMPLVDESGTILGLVSVRDIVNFVAEHFPEEIYNHPPVLNQPIETQEGG